MAAGIVGGGYGLATGSLSKGLTAGLGAYGGAGLAGGLMGAGTESLISAAAPSAGEAMAAGAGDYTANLAANATIPAGAAGNLATMKQGLGSLATAGGPTAFMGQMGGGAGLAKAGLMAATPILADAMVPTTTKAPALEQGLIRPYTYAREKNPTAFQDVAGDPMSSKERLYFTDKYTAGTPYKAPGPEYKTMAAGGPVEEMSNANAIGANTGYPQSGIRTSAYATPFQQPMGQNMVTGAQDVSVDPYTGQEQRTAPAPQAQFADGGSIGGYTYDPVSQTYSTASGQGVTTVKPPGFKDADKMSDTFETEMNPQVNDYLTWEETTPAGRTARDARMAEVNNLLSLAVPGAALAGLVSGRTPSVPNFSVLFGTPQTYADYQAAHAYGMDPVNGPGTIGSRDNRGSNESVTPDSGPAGADPASDAGRDAGNSGSAPGGGAAAGGLMTLAQGGISNLGGYSDGGQLLRGPGDGVSDDIPAMIGQKQQARLADGEFVVPARIVSELGNGSTEAGARQLYAMMDRVQKNRKKSMGKGKVATDAKSRKLLPA
jgi:hypothetical protein